MPLYIFIPSKTSEWVYVLLSKRPSVWDDFRNAFLATGAVSSSSLIALPVLLFSEAKLLVMALPEIALPVVVLSVYVLKGVAAEAYETVLCSNNKAADSLHNILCLFI